MEQNAEDASERLEEPARLAQEWASRNAVEFDLAKTETILFSHQNDKFRAAMERYCIRVGEGEVPFNRTTTRWLGIRIDSYLKLREHRNMCMKKAKATEVRIRRLTITQGLNPVNVKKIQTAMVQSIMLYEQSYGGARSLTTREYAKSRNLLTYKTRQLQVHRERHQ